ncbi:MAG: helix-turn-helix domain-containing protein [Sporolactobacillus sp.]
MDVKQLAVNYPGTKIKTEPFQPQNQSLYFYEEPYYIEIPSHHLSDREQHLLKILLNQEIPPEHSRKAQFWYDLLIQGLPFEKNRPEAAIVIIQFCLTSAIATEDWFEWKQALEAFFPESTSFIYLSSRKGLVIEEQLTLSGEELQAIANTLENDFSIKCYFQIGLRYSLSPNLRKAFLEERQLFEQYVATSNSQAVTSMESNFFLSLKPLMREWAILDEVREAVAHDKMWLAIIHALWEQQGNMSLAAKRLFMHRNTLQYRIDKFFERTGISLKKMDGLSLAYLAIL